jgi:hypothetical protein
MAFDSGPGPEAGVAQSGTHARALVLARVRPKNRNTELSDLCDLGQEGQVVYGQMFLYNA